MTDSCSYLNQLVILAPSFHPLLPCIVSCRSAPLWRALIRIWKGQVSGPPALLIQFVNSVSLLIPLYRTVWLTEMFWRKTTESNSLEMCHACTCEKKLLKLSAFLSVFYSSKQEDHLCDVSVGVSGNPLNLSSSIDFICSSLWRRWMSPNLLVVTRSTNQRTPEETRVFVSWSCSFPELKISRLADMLWV